LGLGQLRAGFLAGDELLAESTDKSVGNYVSRLPWVKGVA
jgi:hypothetical protein